jgi:hypothetical protein
VKFMIRSSAFALFISAVCLLLPKAGQAGVSGEKNFAYCVRYSDNSGWCEGSYAAFQASTDPNAYAEVSTSTMGNGLYFFAEYNNTYVSCLVPWTAGFEHLQDQITKLPLHKGGFYVAFNAGGYCTDVDLYQASFYNE